MRKSYGVCQCGGSIEASTFSINGVGFGSKDKPKAKLKCDCCGKEYAYAAVDIDEIALTGTAMGGLEEVKSANGRVS